MLFGRLRWFSSVLPVPSNGSFGCRYSLESLDVEVEYSELVLCEYIAVRLSSDATPDVVEGLLEIRFDRRIQFTFGIAGNVDGTLVVESTYSVNVCIVVGTHVVAVQWWNCRGRVRL